MSDTPIADAMQETGEMVQFHTTHHFAEGLYCKEMRIPAGYIAASHRHVHDHISVLMAGRVTVTVDGVRTLYYAPSIITVKKGLEHGIYAHTDSIWLCINATNETEPDKADEVLIMKG